MKIVNNLPNALTMLRVLAIPLFLWLVFFASSPDHVLWSLVLFSAAALTDWLDGYLARKLDVVSSFGKIMDPLADKLLVLCALAGITWSSPFALPAWIFFIILIRELAITILREVYKKRGYIMPADQLGKLKTVMQMTGLVAAYALWAWMPRIPQGIYYAIHIWFWLVTLITIISGLNYLRPKASGA